VDSAAEVGDEPQDEREHKADEQAGGQGEIEGSVFATMDDVAREMPEAEGKPGVTREAAVEIEQSAGKHQDAAENEKHAADFTEKVHSKVHSEVAKTATRIALFSLRWIG